MASEVEICNIALSQVQAGSINSLSESSKEAQQCLLHYANARDQVLTETDWGFNTTIEALAQLSSVTVFNWAYVWTYPSDCLQINTLIRNVQSVASGEGLAPSALRYGSSRFRTPQDFVPVEYEVMNVDGVKVIVSKESTLRANYRKKVTDPNLIPANVRDAISMLLASKIAVPLAGSKEGRVLRTDALGLYNAWVTKAADQNGNESFQEEQESEYILVRESV